MIGKIVSPYLKKSLYAFYQKQNRAVKLQNLNYAKKIGIIWNPADDNSIDSFDSLLKLLNNRNIETTGIGYIASKQEREALSTISHSLFIDKKELSIFKQSQNSTSQLFIEQQFDILIDTSIRKEYVLQYLLVHSAAKFKVGWKNDSYNFYDFNVDINNQPNCKYLTEQIIFYLDKINEKNE